MTEGIPTIATQIDNSHGLSSHIGEYYTRIALGPYSRQDPFDVGSWNVSSFIFLPLPTELRDDTATGYGTSDLETIGDILNGDPGSAIGAALLRNAGQIAGSGIRTVAQGVQNMAPDVLGNSITNTTSELFNPSRMTSGLQQTLGVAPNPNPSVAFQGPILRDFSYSWTFYPKNREESRQIMHMIKVLKSNALPKNVVTNSAAILKYPSMCQLNFFPWDRNSSSTNKWYWSDNSIIKIKRCVMASVNANYNSFGVPAFHEGSKTPVTIQISINFKELEYMLSGDWGEAHTSEQEAQFVEELRTRITTEGGRTAEGLNQVAGDGLLSTVL